MPILERRVQVLFEPPVYERLDEYARATGKSVGAVVRDAVARTLDRPSAERHAALGRLLRRSDEQPAAPVMEWEAVKTGFERDHLLTIP